MCGTSLVRIHFVTKCLAIVVATVDKGLEWGDLLLQVWVQNTMTVSSGNAFIGVVVLTFDDCLVWGD